MTKRLLHNFLTAATTIVVMAVAVSCTSESYTPGDGAYSLLRCDFAEARTNSDGALASFVTDEGRSWTVDGAAKVAWMTTPDSLYRAMVYYDVPAEGVPEGTVAQPTKLRSVVQVYTLTPRRSYREEEIKTDPLSLDAIWLSENGKYVNLTLTFKTGTTDGESSLQSIGALLRETTVNADGTATADVVLLHDQADVPQYYSARVYASIPTAALTVNGGSSATIDSVSIEINTYKGLIKRTVKLH